MTWDSLAPKIEKEHLPNAEKKQPVMQGYEGQHREETEAADMVSLPSALRPCSAQLTHKAQ